MSIINRLKLKIFNSETTKDTELADFLGVSRQIISHWRVKNTIDIKIIIEKCSKYDLHYILTGENRESQESEKDKELKKLYEENIYLKGKIEAYTQILANKTPENQAKKYINSNNC